MSNCYIELHIPKEYENSFRKFTLFSDKGEIIFDLPFYATKTSFKNSYNHVVLKYFPYSIKIKPSNEIHVYVTHKLPNVSLVDKIVSMLVPSKYFTVSKKKIGVYKSEIPRAKSRGWHKVLLFISLIALGVVSVFESILFDFLCLFLIAGVIGIFPLIFKKHENSMSTRFIVISTVFIGLYYSQLLSFLPKFILSLGFIIVGIQSICKSSA